ncbi:glycyl-radical enzyme activating protein [Candidatus Bipolaricaulota bacterium]
MVRLEAELNGPVEGLIFDIQAHSLHDGPGCRTTIFLSGCPLRCSWCANPEGLIPQRRLMVREPRCRSDGAPCVDACRHGAIRIDPARPIPPRFDRTLCSSCDSLDCVSACLNGALEVSGRRLPLDDLMRVLERDRDYWGPRGGVTFSGGEPLSQPEFLLTALEACRANYIHTVIETSAHADSQLVAEIARRSDWMFVDLKHMDSACHKTETGVGNERILTNFEVLASAPRETRVVVRIPIVPGFNDSKANLHDSARFLARLRLTEVNLLPFHRMAESKYAQLGMTYAHAQNRPPTADEMEIHRRIFVSAGLDCHVGAETPF